MMLILNNVLWINLGIVESYWEMLILVMNRDWILGMKVFYLIESVEWIFVMKIKNFVFFFKDKR